MTVGELKEWLSQYPDDMLVVTERTCMDVRNCDNQETEHIDPLYAFDIPRHIDLFESFEKTDNKIDDTYFDTAKVVFKPKDNCEVVAFTAYKEVGIGKVYDVNVHGHCGGPSDTILCANGVLLL